LLGGAAHLHRGSSDLLRGACAPPGDSKDAAETRVSWSLVSLLSLSSFDSHRDSTATHRRPRSPTYSDCGRISRPLSSCSRAWAVQPATRPMAKLGGARAGTPPTT